MRFSAGLIPILLAIRGGLQVNGLHSSRLARIDRLEKDICEPRKQYLDSEGCRLCICNEDGYGGLCESRTCVSYRPRDIDDRECTPYREFRTRCHFCKCSSAGYPTGCIEKDSRCLDDLLDDMDRSVTHSRDDRDWDSRDRERDRHRERELERDRDGRYSYDEVALFYGLR